MMNYKIFSFLNFSRILFGTVSLVTSIILSSCSNLNPKESTDILVLKNINLISMESDEVVYGQSIIIKNNLIHFVGSMESAKYPRNAKVIDAEGKYVIPGLCDMHMHIDHPDVLKVNLAYGVTTVMNYPGLPEHLILKEKAAKNQIFSPNIYTTGDYMDGYPATVPAVFKF